MTPSQIAARRIAQARVNEQANYVRRIGQMARREREAREAQS